MANLNKIFEAAYDDCNIIATQLRDVSTLHSVVFNSSSCDRSIAIVRELLARSGMDALTKHLPRLGKAFDRTLAGAGPLEIPPDIGLATDEGGKIPLFLRELFLQVLYADGRLRPDACATTVGNIRQLLYSFYKYELPYTHEQEQSVVQQFERTEDELSASTNWEHITNSVAALTNSTRRRHWSVSPKAKRTDRPKQEEVVREAKILLQDLFAFFDPKDIIPGHGPGAVATRQKLWAKYSWTNVSARITNQYPFDEYFCSSFGHVCDCYKEFDLLHQEDLPARVILVPKDSRGPRLISAEPVDFQWIQQGLARAIVGLVERHEKTKWNVRFTDQGPNGFGAIQGSLHPERYATLDLAEASDRVSLDLVRLLFPDWLMPYLEAARSSETRLPDGRTLKLKKFAPMGSALCFPILALTIFAILYAASPDRDTCECIYVYGDDVIVPTAFAGDAIEQLESFGLKVNRDKSCTGGFFRESCGKDAFKGKVVTPVRLRTVWSWSRSPDVYTSWISYANSFWDKRYYATYDFLVRRLFRVYGKIPDKDMCLTCPSLAYVPLHQRPSIRRINLDFQKVEYLTWDVRAPLIRKRMRGWSMLLRWFTEGARSTTIQSFNALDVERNLEFSRWRLPTKEVETPFKVRSYTQRNSSILEKRWR